MIQLLASSFHGAILAESIVILVLIIAVIAIYVIKNKNKGAEPVEEPVKEEASSQEPVIEPVKEEAPSEKPVNEPVNEPVAEPVEEPVEEVVEQPVEEVVEETAAAEVVPTVTAVVGDDDEDEEAHDWTSEVFFSKKGEARIILNRSFAAKLCQSKDEVKLWYSDLKNCLLSYKDVKVRKSWKRESFYIKNKCIAKMSIRGKTLCLYVAVKPDKYSDTKYKVEDVSETKIYAITPCMYRMRNARRAKYATQIISEMLATITERIEGRERVDYRPATATTEELIQKGLIKVIEKQ